MLVVKTPAMSKCVLYSARGRMQLKSFFLGHLAVPLFSRALPKNLCLVDWVVPPEFSITGSGEGNIWRKPWKKIDVYHILSYFIIMGSGFLQIFPWLRQVAGFGALRLCENSAAAARNALQQLSLKNHG